MFTKTVSICIGVIKLIVFFSPPTSSSSQVNLADNYGYYDTQWELLQPKLHTEVSIGRGTFGDVYKATLHSAISPGSAMTKKETQGPRDVLVKSLRSEF